MIFIHLILIGCGSATVKPEVSPQLVYLDEYIIPADFKYENTLVGGLSDLDYDGTDFYSIVDLPSSPRIYRFDIVLKDYSIDSIYFKSLINIDKNSTERKIWDSEGLIYDPSKDVFIVSSEGSIKSGYDPFIAELNNEGELLNSYTIPDYFKSDVIDGLHHNGAFEGLDSSVDDKGIWMATELPMRRDGAKPKLYKSSSPIRFTYFDKETKQAEFQFIYQAGPIQKFPLLPFAMNGISAILEIKPKQFLVLERSFSAGHNRKGFSARIYHVDAREATNSLHYSKLYPKKKEIIPAKKKLIFDFKDIRDQLSEKQIDNLEGITFGPDLPNGNKSLVLISDNNFSSWTSQLNQIILMELKEN